MMMGNKNKKVAMLIVKGLADFQKEADPSKEQEVSTEKEHAESDDSRLGIEVAMEKFIGAVQDKDVKKAVQAMLEFQDMCSGVEYHDTEPSMHDKD